MRPIRWVWMVMWSFAGLLVSSAGLLVSGVGGWLLLWWLGRRWRFRIGCCCWMLFLGLRRWVRIRWPILVLLFLLCGCLRVLRLLGLLLGRRRRRRGRVSGRRVFLRCSGLLMRGMLRLILLVLWWGGWVGWGGCGGDVAAVVVLALVGCGNIW